MNHNDNERATFDPGTGHVTFPTTQLPCPEWCDGPVGHGFDSDDHGGLVRNHEHAVGALGVLVVMEEHADVDDGPVTLAHCRVELPERLVLEASQLAEFEADVREARGILEQAS